MGARPPAFSPAQVVALQQLRYYVSFFFASSSKAAQQDWKTNLKNVRLNYNQEEVKIAQPLSLDAIKPALPPKEPSGRIRAIDLAEGPFHRMLMQPSLVLTPPDTWPEAFSSAKVHCEPAEWRRIARHLVDINLVSLLTPDQLWWRGGPKAAQQDWIAC